MGSIIKTRRPAITFAANGQITISAWTMDTLGLNPGDAINLWEENGEVYLYGIKQPEGRCRARLSLNNKGAIRSCRCRSVELCRYILDIMGGERSYVAGINLVDLPVGKGLQLILRNIC